jgi:hypothetical protein
VFRLSTGKYSELSRCLRFGGSAGVLRRETTWPAHVFFAGRFFLQNFGVEFMRRGFLPGRLCERPSPCFLPAELCAVGGLFVITGERTIGGPTGVKEGARHALFFLLHTILASSRGVACVARTGPPAVCGLPSAQTRYSRAPDRRSRGVECTAVCGPGRVAVSPASCAVCRSLPHVTTDSKRSKAVAAGRATGGGWH